MHRTVQANIDRLGLLLETETDPQKRSMIMRLRAEEEARLAARPPKTEA